MYVFREMELARTCSSPLNAMPDVMPGPVPDTFVDDLAFELPCHGVPVLRSELRRWLGNSPQLVRDEPGVGRWARAFLPVAARRSYRAVTARERSGRASRPSPTNGIFPEILSPARHPTRY